MRVTEKLYEWLAEQRHNRRLSFKDMERASGVSHASFSRLYSRNTQRIDDKMVSAICSIFGVSDVELLKIAKGGGEPSTYPQKVSADVLWEWIGSNHNRIAALRAMGYDGDLPEHKKGKR